MKEETYGSQTKKSKALAIAPAFAILENAIQDRHGLTDLPLTKASVAKAGANLKLLPPKSVASLLGLSEKTLANWRCAGTQGLPFVKIGSRIFYRSADVHAFIINNSKQSTSDQGGHYA